MSQLEFFVNVFITLFALLDPIGLLPIFAGATSTLKRESRQWLIVYITLFTAIGLVLFYFSGLALLKFFGISLPAFRIAGGILLFFMGLEMARGDFGHQVGHNEDVVDKEGNHYSASQIAKQQFEKMVVPFAFPLMIGPSAISAIIIFADNARKIEGGTYAAMAAILCVSLATLVVFFLGNTLSKLLGKIGMVIVIRVMGLILCALSVQIMITSFGDIIPNLITHTAAHPYEKSH